jgi:4-hydroxymandelate oxidase
VTETTTQMGWSAPLAAAGAAPVPTDTLDADATRPPYLGRPDLDQIFSVEDFVERARERMHPTTFGYIANAAGSGWTTRNNMAAFERWMFRPRVLVDVSAVDTSTTVLGTPISLPLMFAPTSVHKLSHPDGEAATARAAKRIDTVQVLSSGSSTGFDEIAAIGPKRWFQLYWFTDREITRALVQGAAAAGFGAIAVTVDAAAPFWREWEARTKVVMPEGATAAILPTDVTLVYESTLTWQSLEWLRSISPLPIVLKGIVRGDDARLAAEHGADAIIVSNHGGRQIDGAIATLDALPHVVEGAAGAHGRPGNPRMEIYLDGGVRRGTDMLKALALGARAVLIGRPVQWGLATGGEEGILRMVELIGGEFASAMGLCGAPTVGDITRAMVTRNPDPMAGRVER